MNPSKKDLRKCFWGKSNRFSSKTLGNHSTHAKFNKAKS